MTINASIWVLSLGFFCVCGVILEILLAKSEVDHITVVEMSEDVIKLVAPHYEKEKRVTIATSPRWMLGIAALGGVISFALFGLVISFTEEGDGNANQNALYIEECGACHVAYPPGLLPVQSWQEIMLGLSDHFEDNAEMDQETADEISRYLGEHALRMGRPSTMSEMLRNIPDKPPIRITELPAFISVHDNVHVQADGSDNQGVYLSRCAECHSDAEKGSFDENSIL